MIKMVVQINVTINIKRLYLKSAISFSPFLDLRRYAYVFISFCRAN
jgi:hypothetical protein